MDQAILIIGAGPVGLSLALALIQQNIPVILFEQGKELAKEIRASTFHPPTLEKMQAWGVLDAVLAQGHRVDRLQFWDREERKIIGDFDYGCIAEDTPYPFRLQCPQHIYAAALLEKVLNHPLLTFYYEHEFVSCHETARGIEAQFKTPNGFSSWQGRLLCGADGANSALRRSLNIGFTGMTYEDRFLLVASDFNLQDFYPGIAPVSYIFDPEEWVIALQLTGLIRLVFQVNEKQDGDVELLDVNLQRRVTKFLGKNVEFPILHKSIYRVHQRVAEHFRVGRAILLGDAAHINNPASGMGMNSGILDAACLSDKIAEAIMFNSDEPLDQYCSLRRHQALDKIKQYSQKRYQDMSNSDRAARQTRNLYYEQLSHDKARSRTFLLEAAMLEDRI